MRHGMRHSMFEKKGGGYYGWKRVRRNWGMVREQGW